MRGHFITIEGPDGSGKSTQIDLLRKYLEDRGLKVALTREPGGTAISEKIRELVLSPENTEMCKMTEALLYAAARAQHVEEKIIPLLEEDYVVICDRFVDSSVVYQGVARNLGIDVVEGINKYAIQNVMPESTFLLYIDAEEGIKRKSNQQELDRLEAEDISFHKTVCQGYKELHALHKQRIRYIDASQSIEKIHKDIIESLKF